MLFYNALLHSLSLQNSDKSLMLAFNAIVFFALAGSATIIAVLSSQVVGLIHCTRNTYSHDCTHTH